MKPNLWIFSIESIETRYTCEWYEHIPCMLHNTLPKFNVQAIVGVQKHTAPTPGAFLNFSDTNYWKSTQLCNFLESLNAGRTTADDHFLFPDAWDPVVLQLRYISDLHGYNWKFHGLFHAGSWDPSDFLGRSSGGKPWCNNTERAMFHAYDHSYFATDFHIGLFYDYLLKEPNGPTLEEYLSNGKIVKSGWPMSYMRDALAPYRNLEKRDLILFPHRIAPEKQVEIFKDLERRLPQYEFIVCQETPLPKHEYRVLLGQAKILFSASLQETLGISTCAEAPIVDAVPLAPSRLSYSEIFKDFEEFLYPSAWTADWESYERNADKLVDRIVHTMENYNSFTSSMARYVNTVYPEYFTPDALVSKFTT